MTTSEAASFEALLFRWDHGPGSWTFVRVPEEQAPGTAGAFGRYPVVATVDGVTWRTSVWRDRRHGWLLAVPGRVRRGKDDGDRVQVEISPDVDRL